MGKNETGKKSLDKMAADPRIEDIWYEGEDGYWATLADGYVWEEVHTLHEHTVRELYNALRYVEPEQQEFETTMIHRFVAGRGRPPKDPSMQKCSQCGIVRGQHG